MASTLPDCTRPEECALTELLHAAVAMPSDAVGLSSTETAFPSELVCSGKGCLVSS